MSFFYNARWGNPVPYQAMGHWGGGYSMGAFDASDFTAEQIKNAVAANNALVGLKKIAQSIKTQPIRDKIVAAPTGGATGGVFELGDHEQVYAAYASIYDADEQEVVDDTDQTILDNATKEYSGGVIADFSALSDALGKAYEDYFAAYYDEEAGKQQAKTGQPAPTTPSATGKPRIAAVQKPTPRKNNWLMYAAIGGGVLGAVWLGMKLLKK